MFLGTCILEWKFFSKDYNLWTGSQQGWKKNSAIESVIPWAKRVEVRAWIRERSEWDMGEPVDIVFDTPFRPLVISLLQISQVGN